MKTRRLLPIAATAALAFFSAGPSARACQYCQLAADPEAYRFMTDRPVNGTFPLESTSSNYSAAAPTNAPEPAAVITELSALPSPVPAHPGGAPNTTNQAAAPRRAALPPPGSAASSSSSRTPPPAATRSLRALAADAHLADLGLVALCGALGFFLWRTRRPRAGGTAALEPSASPTLRVS